MLAPITEEGGTNRCWGKTATYIANEDLNAGRIVSMADQSQDTGSAGVLRVGYLKVGASTVPGVAPIGITQHNCLSGAKILLCILGYTTVIATAVTGTPKRGSIVLGGTDSDKGKVRIGIAPAATQARIGYVSQSASISVGDPILIHYEGYFQAT
jgi:hypothetical protein